MDVATLREKLHQYIDKADEVHLATLYVATKKLLHPVLTPEQIMLVNKEREKIQDDPAHFIIWEEGRKTLASK